MISVPLLKQSIKANGVSWLLVTFATAFMLAVIISVLGGLNASEIRTSLRQEFIESEIESQVQAGAIDAYTSTTEQLEDLAPKVIDYYDLSSVAISTYKDFKAQGNPNPKDTTINLILLSTPIEQKEQVRDLLDRLISSYNDEEETSFITTFVGNEIVTQTEETDPIKIVKIKALVSIIITEYKEKGSLITNDLETISKEIIESSFYDNISEENKIFFLEYGYNSVKINALVSSGIVQYQALIVNGLDKKEAIKEITESLANQLPENVATSLTELGNLNINNLVVGTIFYKMAGIILPMVYTIMTANNLIAGQVDSGSMAYVLSTPTKRKKVTITQMLYLIGSIFLLYVVLTITGIITSEFARKGEFTISNKELLLLNLGGFITLSTISSICFLCSSWFNRSKHAIGVGGGISMFFLVTTILGLFGSPVMPSAIRIEAMNYFNYVSIITLFDAVDMLDGGSSYWFKLLILFGVAVVLYIISIWKFDKKDLPL